MMKYTKPLNIAHKNTAFKEQPRLTAMAEEAVFLYSIGYDVIYEHLYLRF